MRKPLKNRGTIIVDIILAISLSVIFVAIIAASSISSEIIFKSAQSTEELLNLYDAGDTRIDVKLYGNDRNEESIGVSTSSSSIDFTKITAVLPDTGLADSIGTPLCTVDYTSDDTVGSYEYFSSLVSKSTTDILASSSITVTQIILPIDPTLPLTDLEVRNNIAYISADSANASDSDLLIANIGDPDHPVIISSINTGPGLAAITLAGRRVFAAAPSTAAELHVIRLDGLSNLVLEKKFKLPLPYATATPPLASSIFFNNKKIYLGTEKWDGDEFNIIDVTNPASPTKIGGVEIGSKVNDLYVRNGWSYVAASNHDQILVIDTHDSTNPNTATTFGPSGWPRQEGKVFSYFENSLDFGRTSGGYNYSNDHEIFDWPASTSPDHSFSNLNDSTNSSVDVPGGVYGIVRDRTRIYLATRNIDKELQVYDQRLSSSTAQTFSLPIAPQTMTCDGHYLYILAHLSPVIYKISFVRN